MKAMEVYESLAHLRDIPIAFENECELIFEKFVESLPESKRVAARQQFWRTQAAMRDLSQEERIEYLNSQLMEQVSAIGDQLKKLANILNAAVG